MLPSKFKPALIGTGFWLWVTLIVGELLKLVLVERLFNLTRDKLTKFPPFGRTKGGRTKFRETWLKTPRPGRPLAHLASPPVSI